MTRAAAKGYRRHGIRVNAVCPGHIEAPMLGSIVDDEARLGELIEQYPLGRIGRPNDVAEAVVWLCSDSASFVTGVSLPVDGGFTT